MKGKLSFILSFGNLNIVTKGMRKYWDGFSIETPSCTGELTGWVYVCNSMNLKWGAVKKRLPCWAHVCKKQISSLVKLVTALDGLLTSNAPAIAAAVSIRPWVSVTGACHFIRFQWLLNKASLCHFMIKQLLYSKEGKSLKTVATVAAITVY